MCSLLLYINDIPHIIVLLFEDSINKFVYFIKNIKCALYYILCHVQLVIRFKKISLSPLLILIGATLILTNTRSLH